MLQGLDCSLPIFVRTDASDEGFGVFLCQYVDNKKRVIFFAKRTLNKSDKKISACVK